MSMVAVCCGKGSPGCTFVSVNLAFNLSALGDEVLLMDVDPSGGDVAAHLGLDTRRGLYPLMRSEGASISAQAILNESEDRAGVSCIGGFHAPGEADPDGIADGLEAALETGKTVVADFGRVTPDTAPMLSAADLVLVAVRPDLVGVYGAKRAIDSLTGADVSEAAITAVISGWRRRRPAELAEAAQALKVKVIGAIPRDDRRARKAIASQRPLKKGAAARAVRSLASEVARVLAGEVPVPVERAGTSVQRPVAAR